MTMIPGHGLYVPAFASWFFGSILILSAEISVYRGGWMFRRTTMEKTKTAFCPDNIHQLPHSLIQWRTIDNSFIIDIQTLTERFRQRI